MSADQPSDDAPRNPENGRGICTLSRPPIEAEADGAAVRFTWHTKDAKVVGDLVRGEAGVAISHMEIAATTVGGITRDFLRSIPLGEVLSGAREFLLRLDTRTPLSAADPSDSAAPQGRTQMTPELLRRVAVAFIQETGPGKNRGATQRMADRFMRPKGTVQTWIKRARQDGWLAPGPPGRMGAEPGPKLLQWLGEAATSAETVHAEAARIAKSFGATTRGTIKAALRAYEDPTERDLAHRVGTPPLETAVVAECLFGQPLSAELAERFRREGANQDQAFAEMAAEVRDAIAANQARSATSDPTS